MNARNDLSTILINLVTKRFPAVLEDEERHPEYIKASSRNVYECVKPLGWLYLAYNHPDIVNRFDRVSINRILTPLGYRYESDCGKPVPIA